MNTLPRPRCGPRAVAVAPSAWLAEREPGRARGWRVPGIRVPCLAWLARPGRRRSRLGRLGRPRCLGWLGPVGRLEPLLRSGRPPRLAIPLRGRLPAAWLGPLTGVAGLAWIARPWRPGRRGRPGAPGAPGVPGPGCPAWRGGAGPGRLRREEVLQGGIHARGVVLGGVLLVRGAPGGPGRVPARVAGLRVVPLLELLAGLAVIRRRVVLLRESQGGSRAVAVLAAGGVLAAGAVAVAALALILRPEVLGVVTGEARLARAALAARTDRRSACRYPAGRVLLGQGSPVCCR